MRFYLFFFLIFLFSCTTKEEFVIELNLEQGETYWQEVISTNTVTTEMPMFTNESGSVQKTRIILRVDEVGDDLFWVTAFYDDLEIHLKGDDEQLEEMEHLLNKTKELQEVLKDRMFNFSISSIGEIVEISGFDNIVQGLNEYIESLVPSEQLSAMKLFSFLDEPFFREAMNISMSFYPGKPIRIGDSWRKETIMEGMLNMSINSDYRLKKVDDNFFYIDVQGTIDFDLEGDFFNILAEMGNVDLSGELNGTMKVDRKNGWVIESEISQSSIIAMNMEFPGTGEDSEVRTINNTVSRISGGIGQ